jgi:hypothetical protein
MNPDRSFAPGKHHEIPMEEGYAWLKKLGSPFARCGNDTGARERREANEIIRVPLGRISQLWRSHDFR